MILYSIKQLFLLIPLLALSAIIYIFAKGGVKAGNQSIFSLSTMCIGSFVLIFIGIYIDMWYVRPHFLKRRVNKVKAKTAVPELLDCLKDPRSEIRAAASDRLAIIDGDVTPALIQILSDSPHDHARVAAADTLGEKLDRTALSSLQMALEREKSAFVRKAISQAIKNLEQYGKP